MYIDYDLALKFSECVVKSKQIHATFHENWLETTRNRLAKVTNNWRIEYFCNIGHSVQAKIL